MIVYSKTKKEFLNDVLGGNIDQKIHTSVVRELGHSTGEAERRSWRNSMQYMSNIMHDSEIPNDVGVAIEYRIPLTSKRIDFILTGTGANSVSMVVVIELKQWDKSEITSMDGIVRTYVGGANREVTHPSYQACSYVELIEDYNENVQENNITLKPCAYLHNYEPDNVIKNDFYKKHLEKAPVFLKHDAVKLQDFIKKFIKYGDNKNILYAIENGKIRPSKALADSLSSMLRGNKEFTLIDDQKLVYETALKLAGESTERNKNVLIVEGGPGTGKSVVAINLLVELTNRKNVTQYVTKNSAPREVYQVKLSGKFSKSRIANLFRSSGSFHDAEINTFDSLIVDEAHRLNARSGLFSHLGENQIKELISAAKLSVFFIDEDQRVTLKDIGKKSSIIEWANVLGARVHNVGLASQFRCSGSDGYLAWLDSVLQIRDTANETLEDIDFDFQIIESATLLHKDIIKKNTINNKARMVAGYCWKWISKKDQSLKDIVIDDYSATWNLSSYGQAWIVHPDSVNEVGCIHTCQGLELDYVGVIIGPDMIVRDGKIITDASKRASSDQSLKGIKKIQKENREEADALADMIIKNTYRTLMTRGMKGCYVYSVDQETQEYFRNKLLSNEKGSNYFDNIPDGISLNIDEENER